MLISMLRRLCDSSLRAKVAALTSQLAEQRQIAASNASRANAAAETLEEQHDVNDTLTARLAEAERLIADLRQDKAMLSSRLDIAQEEVSQLTEIITRDRERVAAETATYAKIAMVGGHQKMLTHSIEE